LLSLFLSVAALFALNAITPGVSFVLTVRNTLAHGSRVGYGVAWGLVFADTVLAALALAGLAALMRDNADAVVLMSCVGGLWIAYSGMKMLSKAQAREFHIAEGHAGVKMSMWSGFKSGSTVGLSNPQAIVFFASVFIAGMADGTSLTQSVGTVLTIFFSSMLIRCGIVKMVTFPSIKNAYLKRRQKIELISGLALFVMGGKMVFKAYAPWVVKAFPLLGM
jgi:threonine/homoserine/homoserine lactone efflux protein